MQTIDYKKDEERQRIGDTLKALRESKGLSIDNAAVLSGLNRPTIINIEHGRFSPGLDVLDRYALALGLAITFADDIIFYQVRWNVPTGDRQIPYMDEMQSFATLEHAKKFTEKLDKPWQILRCDTHDHSREVGKHPDYWKLSDKFKKKK